MDRNPLSARAVLSTASVVVLVAGLVPGSIRETAVTLTAAGQGGTGRGGGRGGQGSTLYGEHCAACHGTDLSGGRAPTVFDETWLTGVTDERLVASIRDGVAGRDMPPFGSLLDDQQVWELVQYLRTRAGSLGPPTAFVADPDGRVIATEKARVRLEVVTRDLETPWALAFLPDGRLLITERPGRLRIWDGTELSAPVGGTPAVHEQQDGGMFDVEVHPRYGENGWIYLAYSEVLPGFVPPPPGAAPAPTGGRGRGRGPSIPSMTVVVRGRITGDLRWTDQQVIFRAPSELYSPSGSHFGCRMTFDSEGHLFFTLGERGAMADAQDLSKPTGKIHRVHDDGSAPADNPFVNEAGALPTIWSYGHRNPQGLAWDPVTDALWESEHGPRGGDEINVIERGHNYGWAVATKGLQNGVTSTSAPGTDDPIVYFTPSLGPAGVAFYTGDRYPGWARTSLFVGGLVGQELRRLEVEAGAVTRQETLFDQFGRVRDVVQGPDGYFYVALQEPTGSGTGVSLSASTPGLVVRLVPVE